MKNNQIIQLTIQVGKCTIPNLTYLEYSLSVKFNKEISAATTFKNKDNDTCIDFSTKLFLRMEKALFQSFQSCSIVVTGITEKGSRVQIAKGSAKPSSSGIQMVSIKMLRGSDQLSVQMEFKSTPWEMKQSKTINNRLNTFRFHISQKQSSLQSKQQSIKISPSKINNLKDQKQPSKISDGQLQEEKQIYHDHTIEKQQYKSQQKKQKSDELLNKTYDTETICFLQSKIYQYQQKLTKKITQYQQKIKDYSYQISVYSLKMREHEQQMAKHTERQKKYQERINKLICQINDLKQKQINMSKQLQMQRRLKKSTMVQKQQLIELMKLQNEKYIMSQKYIIQLNNYIERIINQNSSLNNVNFIEEKDQILMLNQELELQVCNKNNLINEMKNQIIQLKAKINQSNQMHKNLNNVQNFKAHPISQGHKQIAVTNNAEVNHTKRISGNNHKIQLQKTNKVQKKSKKVQQNKHKEIKNRQIEKKVTKYEIRQKPPVNTGIKKQVRSLSSKPEVGITVKSPKPSNKFVKNNLKLQQRNTMQTEKKSEYECSSGFLAIEIEELQDQNNLLINSRSSPSFVQSTTQPSNKI